MIVVFLLPVLTGGMFVHLLWPARESRALFLKAFLGIGIGLGIWSLLYFLYLLLFAGQRWFILLQVAIFLGLLFTIIWQERKRGWEFPPRRFLGRLTPSQTILVGISCAVFLVSLASTASYLLRRKQGDWDAWMMYNRAARFIYRDQANWLESFSPKMDPIFHADYPLLLAMNIASGWDALGSDTPHVPMVESALFAVACAGLIVSALASIKSVGQAALGLILLWGIPDFVNEGAREMADVPLAFLILATAILIYLFAIQRKPALVVLAGFTAGLAAWTKNEGAVFVIGTGIALVVAFFRCQPWRVILWYVIGLAFPFAIVLYFKLFLAPPSDVLSNGLARSIQQVLDISRHAEILGFFRDQFFGFGAWGILGLSAGIIPVLLIYYLVLHARITEEHRPAFLAGITMLIVQTVGYYGIYLITPYNLTWHLTYSVTRIFLHVFPMITFLILCASRTPESIFGSNAAHPNGA